MTSTGRTILQVVFLGQLMTFELPQTALGEHPGDYSGLLYEDFLFSALTEGPPGILFIF